MHVGDALMMEAVSISETSENFYQTTRRNIPEDSLVFRPVKSFLCCELGGGKKVGW
jgi:hypothetical protein